MHGVVAAGDPQTAAAGAELFAAGGNAMDAIVAAAFAAFVCELPLCSPLGGGVMVVQPETGAAHALDMFGRTPGLGGARPTVLDFDHVEVDFGATTQVFHVGRGSAAVPLALPGLLQAHQRWGSLPLSDVVAPAVVLGRDGYQLGAGVAFAFRLLSPIIERTAESRMLFSDGDRIASTGAQLDNRDLARSLSDICERPERVRDLMQAFAAECGPAAGGLVTERDVTEATVNDAVPLCVELGDWHLATMPGPSTGGVLVALGLRLLGGVGKLPFGSAEHVLALTDVQRTLLSVRDDSFDEECRDAAFVRELLSDAKVAELRTRAAALHPDSPLGSTTHLSALDEHGMAVSLTLTNGEGSGHVLSGTGMVINNLLGEEDIHPRGFHRDPPGKALSTMMAPTVLTRGEDRIVLGSGGSNRLRNAITQVVSALIEHGVTPEVAVTAPRLHVQGTTLTLETRGLAAEAEAALQSAFGGHVAAFAEPNMFFGGVHLALRRRGAFGGAGDARRGGSVRVV
ncbi:MAG: gamma-glutamyltransferase [Polyangiaceae bacterium]|nr:gamma-glutamyltransferase [Polyangiaceae bacterium]